MSFSDVRRHQNATIESALSTCCKPIAECAALVVPTAAYGHPMALPGRYRFIAGVDAVRFGWKSRAGADALPSIEPETGFPWSRRPTRCWWRAETPYLAHWMRESGVADLPSLDMVWAA